MFNLNITYYKRWLDIIFFTVPPNMISVLFRNRFIYIRSKQLMNWLAKLCEHYGIANKSHVQKLLNINTDNTFV